jgi:digeranylgeranylglycerophospholipid reductase
MMEEVQVAVVGAGPAGSTAAEVAATLGAEVTLIEQKREIGSPVQCGGFLPEADELRGLMPRAHLPVTLEDIPCRCILHRTRLQRIFSPSGNGKEFSVAGRIVDRRAFDLYLANRAARAGAHVLPATRADLAIDTLHLTGRFHRKLKPKIIIGADGPNSMVSRIMGNPAQEMGICIEYEMADVDIDADAAEMYFSMRFAPGGYAWIIPLGKDSANVGVGVRPSYLGRQKLPDLLDRFIREHPVAAKKLCCGEVLAVMHGLVPAGGSQEMIQKDNILLAGDAAGHVMATSGGGIPLAMVAGRIAGEIANDHLKGKTALQEYQSRIYEEFGRELKRSLQIRKMVDMAMKSDQLMNVLLASLSPEIMKSIMRAQMPTAFSSGLLTMK